jgi:hypothetical protein
VAKLPGVLNSEPGEPSDEVYITVKSPESPRESTTMGGYGMGYMERKKSATTVDEPPRRQQQLVERPDSGDEHSQASSVLSGSLMDSGAFKIII